MDGILVRAVEEDDLESILGLLVQLKEYAHSEATPDLAHIKDLYRDMLRNPRQYKNMVACVDGVVVGLISVMYYFSFLCKGGTALINELVVSRAYRGSGVGTALVRAVIDISKRDSVDQIEVGTEIENQSAASLYRKLGFTMEYRLFGMNLMRDDQA